MVSAKPKLFKRGLPYLQNVLTRNTELSVDNYAISKGMHALEVGFRLIFGILILAWFAQSVPVCIKE